ncbi:hypothetical protein FNO01nite_28350 [Flavobacterium noncentrifugens]|uniref:Uncharacterized protein n=2 Tax=Flavobacterium noncentrifugens TaxID=1128970 RepID=A0A1G8XSD4_9FLAO|nr:hypothetical protein FNO01nite_28350 [Flavobacterium noncentrifugens]SDJ93366.1 hypothetical protein SAMN04487935_2040 [Flavobacterium noncentrifugens]
MPFKIITLFIFISISAFSQKLPENLSLRDDAITISYFNYLDQNNLIAKEVFVGKKTKFKLPLHNNFERVDISKNKDEIKAIQDYLTTTLIDDILKCCYKKKCPDVIHGYFIMVKKGREFKYATIDYDFISLDLCGSEKLNKIIENFNHL